MAFIAATLMNFFDEENVFWMLSAIIENCNLSGYLTLGLPALPESYFILVKLI